MGNRTLLLVGGLVVLVLVSGVAVAEADDGRDFDEDDGGLDEAVDDRDVEDDDDDREAEDDESDVEEGLDGLAQEDGGEAPLAEAGLDQTVTQGTTVYLDGSGSSDPDGEVRGYEWQIEGPDGGTLTPECGSCAQTQFQPSQVGEYAVEVTVTGADGETETDTLYVTVEASSGPQVQLNGPTRVAPGSDAEFSIDAAGGDRELRRLHVFRDGSENRSVGIDGARDEVNVTQSFGTPGSVRLRVVVRDVVGRTAVDTVNVSVVTAFSSSSSGDPYRRCDEDCFSFGTPVDSAGNFSEFVASTILTNDGGDFELRNSETPDGRVTVLDESRYNSLDNDGDGRIRLSDVQNEELRNLLVDAISYEPVYVEEDYEGNVTELKEARNDSESSESINNTADQANSRSNSESNSEQLSQEISEMRDIATGQNTRKYRVTNSDKVSPTITSSYRQQWT